MSDAKLMRQSISKEQQSGWECASCATINLVYGPGVPAQCLKCGSQVLSKKWEHLITVVETVESMP